MIYEEKREKRSQTKCISFCLALKKNRRFVLKAGGARVWQYQE